MEKFRTNSCFVLQVTILLNTLTLRQGQKIVRFHFQTKFNIHLKS